jgi:RNA polymerase sigma-70 factor (ECF subfamily)
MLRRLFPQKSPPLPDEQLLAQYRQSGDARLLGELFSRHAHLVFAVCMKYLKQEEDAQDASVQVFEALLHKLRDAEVANFKPWLHQVAKNHCLMQLRKAKSQAPKQADYQKSLLADMESEQEAHPMDSAPSHEDRLAALRQAMQGLPDEQRVCLDRFFLQEQSYQQIAQETGYGLNQVKSYLQNGKRNLKKQLLAMGLHALILLLLR